MKLNKALLNEEGGSIWKFKILYIREKMNIHKPNFVGYNEGDPKRKVHRTQWLHEKLEK